MANAATVVKSIIRWRDEAASGWWQNWDFAMNFDAIFFDCLLILFEARSTELLGNAEEEQIIQYYQLVAFNKLRR